MTHLPRQLVRATVRALAILLIATAGAPAFAAERQLSGTVRDDTGGALPGVVVELRGRGVVRHTVTEDDGRYRIGAMPGPLEISFTLANFATVRRALTVADADATVDAVMHLSLNADVTVTGKSTFTNLADARTPTEDLVGIAQAASQGAITARQLETRPIARPGEVLETVPGVVISQHSGDGKANQYYLRGFNLDHGTDFATTVAGMPVNLPTHGHGHGYSDLNFLIPELASGVQFSKGPYFAEHGDFTTAGTANINYTNTLGRPIARVGGGGDAFGRILLAAAPAVAGGHLLGAIEVQQHDGPWERPDDSRKLNAVLRYSRGDTRNGLSATLMGYRATWNATDQIPARAVADGRLGRFGLVDPSNGGDSSRYSASFEWQRTNGASSTKATAFGITYGLDLFSNFTYFLDDPVNGDQFQQTDRRFVSGARISHRTIGRWAGRPTQNTVGFQLRNDRISDVGLYHTRQRHVLETLRTDSVVQTSAGTFAQNETQWTAWLRTLAGVRVDGYRFVVDAGVRENAGTEHAGLASPKGGAVLGPFAKTELYVNAGRGFHSNDARGATIAIDPASGEPASRVTPLARAAGAEVGIRTVRIPRVQMTLTAWTLGLESELVFIGDAGTTAASRPSRRQGIEWTTYYSPQPWLVLDADLAVSRARFTDDDPAGSSIPGAVATVVSAGATINAVRNVFGSVRWRYFGPRALVEDGLVRSKATSLVSLTAGYKLTSTLRLALDVFNLFDAKHSDIDYFYTSRLPGEPAGGVDDFHVHPAAPRTARLNLMVGF
jgi:TonB dependent receptor/TonB-dependent Receptor Plug Domain/Carboxypeptidase regulatory-like domain